MPLRELKYPHQIDEWLKDWGGRLTTPGEMILIGSGALLWHAFQEGLDIPLTENSMDVDPVTEHEEIALLGYESLIGSEFEQAHGWHVNLMPRSVMDEFPAEWRERARTAGYGRMTVIVPSVSDLLVPKLKRGEPRDRVHAEWARQNQLIP